MFNKKVNKKVVKITQKELRQYKGEEYGLKRALEFIEKEGLGDRKEIKLLKEVVYYDLK